MPIFREEVMEHLRRELAAFEEQAQKRWFRLSPKKWRLPSNQTGARPWSSALCCRKLKRTIPTTEVRRPRGRSSPFLAGCNAAQKFGEPAGSPNNSSIRRREFRN